jgi:CheY-like chemotaxis protein
VHQAPVVLVVEDEPIIRMMAVDLLEDAGYEVLEACDAHAAVAVLERRDDVVVVFTDIDMPGRLDGMGLAAAIRDRWPPIEIIVTSGKRRPPAAAMPDRGVFLPKPYRPEEIAGLMRRMAG